MKISAVLWLIKNFQHFKFLLFSVGKSPINFFSSSKTDMPALFFGYGSPMNAIDGNQFKIHHCTSAHWMTEGTRITKTDNKTIHDL